MTSSMRFLFRSMLMGLGIIALIAGLAFPVEVSATPAPDPSPATVSQATAGAFAATAVPAGVCAVDVAASGAGGGASFADNGVAVADPITDIGGAGATIQARIPAHPTQMVTGTVGGGGAGAGVGGTDTGGDGGLQAVGRPHGGSGGGGLTNVFVGDMTTAVLVAGGGGGSGGGHAGAHGQNGGDAGVITAAGVAAAGMPGGLGRDLSQRRAPAVLLPGGAGGGTTAPGAGGVHPGSDPTAHPADAFAYSQLDGAAGVGSTGGNGGESVTDLVANAKDSGGGGGGGFFGGGGGVGTNDNGSSGTRPLDDPLGIGGSGGGGGSSFLIGTVFDGANSPAQFTASTSALNGGVVAAAGGDGSVGLTWVLCDYDLMVEKAVSPTAAKVGETVTWSITITNQGPDHMTLDDTVSLTDVVPGTNAATLKSVSLAGAPQASGLDATAFSCAGAGGTLAIGSTVPTALECSRPFASAAAAGVTAGGVRGLDVGEALVIEMEQVLDAADLPSLTNQVDITDRDTPGNNSATAPLTVLPLEASVALAKTAASPVNNGDGTYAVTYTHTVTNDGDLDLSALSLTDDMAGIWGAALTSAQVSGGSCANTNPSYDGDLVNELFLGQALAPATSCTVDVLVQLDIGATGSAFVNTTITNTADVSGTPAGGGLAPMASASADVVLAENPAITVTKSVTSGPTTDAGGIAEIEYTLTVANSGQVDLSSVSLTDDLSAVWGAGLQPAPVVGGTCSLESGFLGTGADIELLAGQSLAVGASCTVTILLNVDVSSAGDPALIDVEKTNNVQAAGTPPSQASVVTDSATAPATVAAPAPTPEPTTEPTPEPTTEPTAEPTTEPTPEPTSTGAGFIVPRGVFDAAAEAKASVTPVPLAAPAPAAAAAPVAQPSSALAVTGVESQILTMAGFVLLGSGACLAAGERRRRRLDQI